MPTFSVIMPTRNRAALFERALDSVLAQTGASYEVVVVNDGTSGMEAAALDRVKTKHSEVVRFIDLPITPTGHGCFRVMNTGALASTGEYLCFLDDDDEWIDPHHLAEAQEVIDASHGTVDVMFFDQVGVHGDAVADGPIWIEDLGERFRDAGAEPPHIVTPTVLLTAHGFAHTNITIVRRQIFDAIGGFDTNLWYEGDRDFYLRVIDAAADIRYVPHLCARHHIPANAGRSSMSNTTSAFRKASDQVKLLHKALRNSKNADVRKYARRHRRYAIRKALDATSADVATLLKLARLAAMLLRRPSDSKIVVGVED